MKRILTALAAAVVLAGSAVGYIALTGEETRPASGHVEAPQRLLFLTNGVQVGGYGILSANLLALGAATAAFFLVMVVRRKES